MQLHQFLNQVQHSAEMDSRDDALKATRATLTTLSERLKGNEPAHVAAQLPKGLEEFLTGDTSGKGERFGSEEFMRRVSAREGVELGTAAAHARVVLDVLSQAVAPGEIDDVKQQLPGDLKKLISEASASMMPR